MLSQEAHLTSKDAQSFTSKPRKQPSRQKPVLTPDEEHLRPRQLEEVRKDNTVLLVVVLFLFVSRQALTL